MAVTTVSPAPWAGAGLIPVVNLAPAPGTHVLTVGVGKAYATIAAAVNASVDGDLIRVDAGTYTNDFATILNKITLEGVGGMVNMVATIPPPNLKGILLVDNDVTIKNFAFSGSAVPDVSGGNGAGIRYEGGQMVLSNTSFVGNQDGILAYPVLGLAVNTIVIDHSLFSGNGSGTGQTHNLYVNQVSSLIVTNSIFEKAVVGHEFKSRALINDIQNNIFRDTSTGTASYSIDLPNGGKDLIKNNLIEKGPMAENKFVIHYGGEAIPYAGSYLTVQGNVIANSRSGGVGVLNQTNVSVSITGNTLSGFDTGNLLAGPGVLSQNIDGAGVAIADSTLTGVLPGATTVYTDALAHAITLGTANTAVQGGAGRLSVMAIAGHVVAIGGSGGMDFAEGPTSGGNSISTAAGSVNSITVVGQDLIDSRGTDRIIVGNFSVNATVSGDAIIDDGYNNDDRWTINGNTVMTGHGGRPVVSVGATANFSLTGPVGYLQVITNGGNAQYDVVQGGARQSASIVGGAIDVRLYSGFFTMSTAAGPGALIRLGAGDGTLTSRGSDTIYAGSGNETIILTASATVYAGTGNLSVFGRGISPAGATFYGNGGNYVIDGDTGNITYYGGAQNSTVQVRLSNLKLIGGAGQMTLNGGSRETIVGGAGGLVYTANASSGGNMITTAAGSRNVLSLGESETVTSWGQDIINGGTGSQTMTIYGDSLVNGSSGSGMITFSGNDTLIGVGTDNVTVTPGARLTVSAGIVTNVHETGATVNYSVTGAAGTASAIVTGGGAMLSVGDGRSLAITTDDGSATDVALGGGTISVLSFGADTIHAGSGADTILLTRANTQIWGGAGTLSVTNHDWTAGDAQTVYGGAGAISYIQATGNLTFIGGSGDVTIEGGSGQLLITAGSGNLNVSGGWGGGSKIVAGTGNANVALTSLGGEVVFGAGTATVAVAGWGSAAVFDLVAGSGGGANVIQNFRVGTDRLNLQGVTLQSQQVVAGSTNLVFSDTTRVQLAGVTDTTGLFA